MEPVKFKEQNAVCTESQSEYLPLPVFKESNGCVTSCWKMSFKERILALFSGKIWVSSLTFNSPLQPLIVWAKKPKFPIC